MSNIGSKASRLLAKRKDALFNKLFKQIAAGIITGEGFKNETFMGWAKKHFPENMFSEPGAFHIWIANFLQNFHKTRGQKVAVVAPRGNAKSTWISLFYVSLAALEGWEKYILIVSDSATQARKHLTAVKDAIEFSGELAETYSGIAGAGTRWREDSIKLRNGVVIEAIGTGMKLRGRREGAERPTLIIVDDPQNDENIESLEQREKDISWLNKTVMNAGSKRTNIFVVGTAIHRECMVLYCASNAAWKSYIFQSIITEPFRTDLWAQWEELFTNRNDESRETTARKFYEDNQTAMHLGSDVLWASEESLYDLMKLRVTIGRVAFDSEKQNNPRRADTNEFPDVYFGGWLFIPRKNWVKENKFEHKVLSIDPSKGKESRKGDYSAIVEIGRLQQLIYCKFDIKRRPVANLIADIVSHALEFKPDIIAIENNQFQELLEEDLRQALVDAGLDIKVIGVNNTVNKLVRIRRLGPRFSQKELRFYDSRDEPNTKLAVQQFEDFPLGAHDDAPDALEMGIRVMVDLVNLDFENPLKSNNLFDHF